MDTDKKRCLCRAVVVRPTSCYTLYTVCPFISSQLGLLPENGVKERTVICGCEQVTDCICAKSFDAENKGLQVSQTACHTNGGDGNVTVCIYSTPTEFNSRFQNSQESCLFKRLIFMDCLQTKQLSVVDTEQKLSQDKNMNMF